MHNDLRSLSRSFFACAVVVGIVLLPSLYAWLNIYSNWDPYGNTEASPSPWPRWTRGMTTMVHTSTRGRTWWTTCGRPRPSTGFIVDTEQEATDGVYARGLLRRRGH